MYVRQPDVFIAFFPSTVETIAWHKRNNGAWFVKLLKTFSFTDNSRQDIHNFVLCLIIHNIIYQSQDSLILSIYITYFTYLFKSSPLVVCLGCAGFRTASLSCGHAVTVIGFHSGFSCRYGILRSRHIFFSFHYLFISALYCF